jgi:hypothetical protein
MEEIIIYRADDGTDFEDEYDCRLYEWECSIKDQMPLPVVLLDKHFKPLPVTEPSSFEDCWYIFLGSETAASFLADIWDCDITSTYCPRFLHTWDDKSGLWAYDEDTDGWYHLGNRLKELQTEADKCMETINNELGGI